MDTRVLLDDYEVDLDLSEYVSNRKHCRSLMTKKRPLVQAIQLLIFSALAPHSSASCALA